MSKILKSRFALVYAFIMTYLLLSSAIRLILYLISYSNLSFSLIKTFRIFILGFYFDFGVSLFFILFYVIYLIIIPKKFIGATIEKFLTYFIFTITMFIALFSLVSEFPFWDEFNTRFNFIAVDYLIYTYEVVENINQSYPIPFIVFGLLAIISLLYFVYKKLLLFNITFNHKMGFINRLINAFPILIIILLYTLFATNKQSEWSNNTYENELSKNGIFSFFAAFRSNELDYDLFYPKLNEKDAYLILKKELNTQNSRYLSNKFDDIERVITGDSIKQPNIILITIESFSAEFSRVFGNTQKITPYFDKIAEESILFTNLFATGTRTVRGMEALTLSVPPTPGNSIVRRPNNKSIFSIATILKKKNYDLKFIYGGDGYFDNMNNFFGGQGFDIVDRDRGNPLSDAIKTQRYNIEDNEVSFENAWGICDEDIYFQALKYADLNYKKEKPFFQFIMTTSNHRPYSFPENKIDIPIGSREGAVKYTDFALGEFIEKAKTKPWFRNTVFIVIADHCASSAGKWEINIEKHHIPALIYNSGKIERIDKLCSQIDIMPTLFGLFNWNYNSELYGKDIRKMKPFDERALIGNYRTLGLLKDNIFTEINDKKTIKQYKYLNQKREIKKEINDSLQKLTISYYQTASERFKNGKMKEK